jgi:hypothetical protein
MNTRNIICGVRRGWVEKGAWCVGLEILPPSHASFNHLETLTFWNPRGLYMLYITETLWPECRFNNAVVIKNLNGKAEE